MDQITLHEQMPIMETTDKLLDTLIADPLIAHCILGGVRQSIEVGGPGGAVASMMLGTRRTRGMGLKKYFGDHGRFATVVT
jgi:hypothetical protein